jgi:hypothetical protein
MQTIPSRHKPLGVLARMKQTRLSSLRHACVCIFYIFSFLAVFHSNLTPTALAQKIQQQVLITRINPSAFPSVQVYAILRDRRGKPIPTGKLGGLTMTESVFDHEEVVSDDQHLFTVNSISSGAEVLFVIDAASDLTKPGASRGSYLVVTGSQVEYLQPLTAEKELLNQSLEKIPQSAVKISFGRYGIDRALNELTIFPDKETIVKIRVPIPELSPTATLTPQAALATDVTPTPAPVGSADSCSSLPGSQATLCRITALGKALVSTPSGWFAIGGLLIAIFAILMAFHYRGSINQAGGKALGAMQETLTSLRRPPKKDSGTYLMVLQGDDEMVGKRLPLSPDHTTILGRSLREAELAFQVNQERSVVSRKHCEIQEQKGKYKIIDLGSTHGTFVNGGRLPVGGNGNTLSGSDQIELGPADQGGVLLEFRTERSKAETKIESPDSRPTYFGNL